MPASANVSQTGSGDELVLKPASIASEPPSDP
jgi:hypothetical protein